MRKFLKWAGMVLGVLAVLLVVSFVTIYFKTQARLTRVCDLPEETVLLPTDPASIERGQHTFRFRGCEACHSEGGYIPLSAVEQRLDSYLSLPSQDIPHMEGNIYLDDPAVGRKVCHGLSMSGGPIPGFPAS